MSLLSLYLKDEPLAYLFYTHYINITGKYKYANKKVTFSADNGRLNGVSTIAVTESGTYRMRILIKEYKGTTLLSKREIYKTLDKNGY